MAETQTPGIALLTTAGALAAIALIGDPGGGSSDQEPTPVAPPTKDGGSNLFAYAALIGSVAALVGSVAALVTAYVGLAALRSDKPRRARRSSSG